MVMVVVVVVGYCSVVVVAVTAVVRVKILIVVGLLYLSLFLVGARQEKIQPLLKPTPPPGLNKRWDRWDCCPCHFEVFEGTFG